MYFKVLLGCVFLGLIHEAQLATVTSAKKVGQADARLNKYINFHLDKYGEPNVRPAGKNFSTAVNLHLELQLVRINSFNEENGLLEGVGWLLQNWTDSNVAWDPERFGGLKKINLPVDNFWLPDVWFYNSWNGKTEMEKTRLIVYNTGEILWVPPMKIEAPCTKQNDTWRCEWKLGSWTYNGNEIELSNEAKLKTDDLQSPLGWKVENREAETQAKVYPCCPETYPVVIFKFDLKKN